MGTDTEEKGKAKGKRLVLRKGEAAKWKKMRVLEERQQRSVFVTWEKKVTSKERGQINKIMRSAHPDIVQVFFPRQKRPRFVYILCKKGIVGEKRDEVKKALFNLKTEELGKIRAFNPKKKQLDGLEKETKSKKGKRETQIDHLTLILEMIPSELKTEDLEKAFPKALEITRFNNRRCYIQFKTAQQAMKARIKLSKKEIAGHKLKSAFRTIQIEKEDSSDDNASTAVKAKDTIEDSPSSDIEQSDADDDEDCEDEEDNSMSSEAENDQDITESDEESE